MGVGRKENKEKSLRVAGKYPCKYSRFVEAGVRFVRCFIQCLEEYVAHSRHVGATC